MVQNPSSFMTQVWARLPNFCKYEFNGTKLVGKAACKAMLKDIDWVSCNTCT